jgi:hypothetical protein
MNWNSASSVTDSRRSGEMSAVYAKYRVLSFQPPRVTFFGRNIVVNPTRFLSGGNR